MPVSPRILAALTRPETAVFMENQAHLQSLTARGEALVAAPHHFGTVWHLPTGTPATGPRILVIPTGHAIILGDHGLRILYLDPGGTPLHECAWDTRSREAPRLLRARLHLDWGQWVGLKPEGLVNVAEFDLSRKPGWQRLTRADLHRMAAQAMGGTPEEVAFFYDEAGLTLDERGKVTLRHRKDAFYALEDGRFERARFLACMGAMHWARIDFLPVVELFQSLLAGTGSAAFELIRGLYDDQNQGRSPRLLRYQGIPTYPSPQAFQLFSTYFHPEAPGGADPFPIFMDPTRSGQVVWRPRPEVPRRYLDPGRGLCVTVAGGAVQKVTRRDDPAALPYARVRKDGFAPGGRMVGATKEVLQLLDGDHREEIPLQPEWGVTQETPLPTAASGFGTTWRALFPSGPPALDPRRAYFAVSLYPEGEGLVEEVATQPLVMEQTLVYLERIAVASVGPTKPPTVFWDNWDAVIAECLEPLAGAECTVLYTRPEFAQRQAQRVWDQAATAGRLPDLKRVSFFPADRDRARAYARTYGLVFRWIPFDQYQQRDNAEQEANALAGALEPGGSAILVGPSRFGEACAGGRLKILAFDPVGKTAGARMLGAILPKARINPEATLFLVQKT
jgi:hypothetical protein